MSLVFDKEIVEMLKESSRAIGFLQPTIREKGTNRILVGRHRKFADSNWPEKEMEVRDDLHRELIILNGNIQRVVTREQTKLRFVRIVKILEAKGIAKHRICAEIAKLKGMPYSQQWIRELLPKEYKMKTGGSKKHHGKNKNETTFVSPEMEEDVKEVPTALDAVTSKSLDGEPIFPFPDCQCKTCSRRNKCY